MIDKKMTNKTCPQCLKTFTTEIPYKQVYCNHECQIKFNANKIRRNIIHQKTCPKCLKSFRTKYSHKIKCNACSPKAIYKYSKACIDYFINRYCEKGEFYISNKHFYQAFNSFGSKYNTTFNLNREKSGTDLLSQYMKSKHNINRADSSNRGQKRRKTLFGIRFNKRGIDKFGIRNIANMPIDNKNITHKEACIITSCNIGYNELIKLYNSFDSYSQQIIDIEKAQSTYKEIEKRMFALNITRKKTVKIALAFYLVSSYGQDTICNMIGTTPTSMRALSNIIKLKKKINTETKICPTCNNSFKRIKNTHCSIACRYPHKITIDTNKKIIYTENQIQNQIKQTLEPRNQLLNNRIRNGEL